MARKAGLTLEDVVTAAAEIADTDGLQAVMLSAVSRRLGVRSPSLYAHVAGLEGLQRHLAVHAAHQMGAALRGSVRGHSGSDALRQMAYAYRRFAHDHPGLYTAAQRAAKPEEDEELCQVLAQPVMPALRALAEAGVAERDVIHSARAFRSALHGFVTLEQGGGFGMPESVDESFARLVGMLLSGIQAVKT